MIPTAANSILPIYILNLEFRTNKNDIIYKKIKISFIEFFEFNLFLVKIIMPKRKENYKKNTVKL